MENYSSRSRDAQRGFTFVEVVLAVSILSVILGMAYSSLNYIIRTKKMLDDRRDISATANTILSRLARELQLTEQLANPVTRLIPPSGSTSSTGTALPFFLGTSRKLPNGESGDEVSFMAQEGGQYIPNGATHSGTVMITYRVEEDPEDKDTESSQRSFILVREEIPNLRPVKKAYENKIIFPISQQVVSFKCAYYDKSEEKWVEEWDSSRRAIPGLLKLDVSLRSPLGRIEHYSTVLPLH